MQEYGNMDYADLGGSLFDPRKRKDLYTLFLFEDNKRDMIEFDEFLLNTVDRTKIVSMGLADFLDFWNNSQLKNGEVLFIPSSKQMRKIKLPFSGKKSSDKLYDYQQKFRIKTIQNRSEYTYEIKELDN